MMKQYESMKKLEIEAISVVEKLFAQIPAIKIEQIKSEVFAMDKGIDFCLQLSAFDKPVTMVFEVKANGQPRYARMAALALRNYIVHSNVNAVPVFVAPYVSAETRKICDEFGIGFIDSLGNVKLQFDGIYIDRTVAEKPASENRFLRSIFSPKASQVLRVMLRDPQREWRVAELAEEANVSFGHVSNVRKALIDKEWAEALSDGIALTKPADLLDVWQRSYKRSPGQQMTFYTHLHGEEYENALRHMFKYQVGEPDVILASFSAAKWLAPYSRISSHHFYANENGVEMLQDVLKLSTAQKGGNVVIRVLKKNGILLDNIRPAPDIICTSEIQTYLDLSISGERGQEAASYLRESTFKWPQ